MDAGYYSAGRRRRELASRRAGEVASAAAGGACTGLKFTLLGARFDLWACSTKPAIENTRSDCALVARTANMGVFSAGGSTMAVTNHDDQRHNLVKFIQRCQMSLTLVKRLYSYWEVYLGQSRNRDTPQVHEKALALADFHGLTLTVGWCTCRQHYSSAGDFNNNTTVGADAWLARRGAKLANY